MTSWCNINKLNWTDRKNNLLGRGKNKCFELVMLVKLSSIFKYTGSSQSQSQVIGEKVKFKSHIVEKKFKSGLKSLNTSLEFDMTPNHVMWAHTPFRNNRNPKIPEICKYLRSAPKTIITVYFNPSIHPSFMPLLLEGSQGGWCPCPLV